MATAHNKGTADRIRSPAKDAVRSSSPSGDAGHGAKRLKQLNMGQGKYVMDTDFRWHPESEVSQRNKAAHPTESQQARERTVAPTLTLLSPQGAGASAGSTVSASTTSMNTPPEAPPATWDEAQVTQINSLLSDWEGRVADLQRERDEAVALADDVAQQLNMQNTAVAQKENELDRMKTMVEETEKMVLEAATTCEHFRTDKQQLEEQLRLLDIERTDLAKRCDKLEEDAFKKSKAQSARAKAQNKAEKKADGLVEVLRLQLMEARMKSGDLESDVEKLKKQVATLKRDKARAVAEKAASQACDSPVSSGLVGSPPTSPAGRLAPKPTITLFTSPSGTGQSSPDNKPVSNQTAAIMKAQIENLHAQLEQFREETAEKDRQVQHLQNERERLLVELANSCDGSRSGVSGTGQTTGAPKGASTQAAGRPAGAGGSGRNSRTRARTPMSNASPNSASTPTSPPPFQKSRGATSRGASQAKEKRAGYESGQSSAASANKAEQSSNTISAISSVGVDPQQLATEHNTLRQECDDLRSQLYRAEQLVEELRLEKQRSDATAEQLRGAVEQSQADAEQSRAEAEAACKQHADSLAELANMQLIITQQAEGQQEAATLQAMMNELEARRKEELKKREAEAELSKRLADAAEAACTQAQAEANAAKQKVEEVLRDASLQVEEAAAAAEVADKNVREGQEKVQALENELATAIDHIESLEQQLQAAQTAHESLVQEVAPLQEAYEQAQNEIATTKALCDALQKDLSEAEQRERDYQASSAELEEEVREKASEVNELMNKVDTVEAQLEQVKAQTQQPQLDSQVAATSPVNQLNSVSLDTIPNATAESALPPPPGSVSSTPAPIPSNASATGSTRSAGSARSNASGHVSNVSNQTGSVHSNVNSNLGRGSNTGNITPGAPPSVQSVQTISISGSSVSTATPTPPPAVHQPQPPPPPATPTPSNTASTLDTITPSDSVSSVSEHPPTLAPLAPLAPLESAMVPPQPESPCGNDEVVTESKPPQFGVQQQPGALYAHVPTVHESSLPPPPKFTRLSLAELKAKVGPIQAQAYATTLKLAQQHHPSVSLPPPVVTSVDEQMLSEARAKLGSALQLLQRGSEGAKPVDPAPRALAPTPQTL
eukprot:TRINITY_DN49282_c0_g1_i1.p1 TRINITY_DN49282_c0_g1~~TRINITY_DN49282_c0_g1_i1.p1  ORF type:complete len:1126 (+),score=184.13 TRINITY_DN49282_c0_g1_i1:56-3433(+)